jgi:hypothetical protein
VNCGSAEENNMKVNVMSEYRTVYSMQPYNTVHAVIGTFQPVINKNSIAVCRISSPNSYKANEF